MSCKLAKVAMACLMVSVAVCLEGCGNEAKSTELKQHKKSLKFASPGEVVYYAHHGKCLKGIVEQLARKEASKSKTPSDDPYMYCIELPSDKDNDVCVRKEDLWKSKTECLASMEHFFPESESLVSSSLLQRSADVPPSLRASTTSTLQRRAKRVALRAHSK